MKVCCTFLQIGDFFNISGKIFIYNFFQKFDLHQFKSDLYVLRLTLRDHHYKFILKAKENVKVSSLSIIIDLDLTNIFIYLYFKRLKISDPAAVADKVSDMYTLVDSL